MKGIFNLILGMLILSIQSCQSNQKETVKTTDNQEILTDADQIQSKTISYNLDGVTYQSYSAFNGDSNEKKPVVMVIPEWWGLNDYAKTRANQLAELGYLAMAMDFYGDGQVVDHPNEAEKLASPFYQDSAKAKHVFEAGLEAIKSESNADVSKIAVMGYCFGGAMALNMGRQVPNLKGVVSFHGNLMTGVKPNNNQVKFLVLNGEADSFVSKDEIKAFENEMDSAKIEYKLIHYPGALHSFTNPNATEVGKKFGMQIAYNQEADEKSWEELVSFLKEIFGEN